MVRLGINTITTDRPAQISAALIAAGYKLHRTT